MRISTSQLFQQSLSSLLKIQNEAARLQQQAGSGERLLSAADDPQAASTIARLDRSLARNDQFLKSSDRAEFRLQREEQAIDSATNITQRARELALRAGSPTLGDADRKALATEIRGGLENLVQIANTRDESGNYIFSGFKGDQPAYVRSNGSYTYNGDSGQRQLQIGPGRSIADGDAGNIVFGGFKEGSGQVATEAGSANTGSAVIDSGRLDDAASFTGPVTVRFVDADSYELVDESNTVIGSGSYVEGEEITVNGVAVAITGAPAANDSFTVRPSATTDLFAAVEGLIAALETPRGSSASRADLQNSVNTALDDLNRGLERLTDSRSAIGARLQQIEQQRDINEGASIQLQDLRSSLADIDFPETITALNRSLLSLEASQRAFARVSSLNLFSVI